MNSNPSTAVTPVLPGATLGVFGSGQLGRMFAIAARYMGYRVHVYSPATDSPAGQVADLEVQAPYDDLDRVAQFAQSVDVLTLEFENIPTQTVAAAAKHTPVHPGHTVLHTLQNRVREKTFLAAAGLPVPPFQAITCAQDLVEADQLLFPGVLKTTELGYDGKGQVMVDSLELAQSGWDQLQTEEAILEQRIPFQCELSIVAARTTSGDKIAYDPFRNDHHNHILDVTFSPSGLSQSVINRAREIAFGVLDALDYVGLLCVEFFLTQDEQLLINEIAPRPHNSGHLTIEAHATSQFEQQVRSICGLPFGSTRQLAPAAMVNLLGDLWTGGEPDWQAAMQADEIKLHLYGKRGPSPAARWAI